MKVGILAAGKIASVMAKTINDLQHNEIELYAIASRSLDKAKAFAHQYNVPCYYGSYEELCRDENVDLIYIASPHSEHHIHAKLCLDYKKAILVEKAFCANKSMAQEVLAYGKAQNTLVAEAIWTRYMPSRTIIAQAINEGKIGEVKAIQANLGYVIYNKERIFKPELAGGALLDLGVYPINFAMMFLGHDITNISGSCIKADTNVDMLDNICLEFKGGKMASLHANAYCATDRNGIIFGTKGYIVVGNINNPYSVEIFNQDHQLIEKLALPEQISGYEYQLLECLEALKNGELECKSMRHQEILEVMEVMDKLRELWKITYPFEHIN